MGTYSYVSKPKLDLLFGEVPIKAREGISAELGVTSRTIIRSSIEQFWV